MSVSALLGSWSTWIKFVGNDDDDWVDRLNHVYTVMVLLTFALFTAGGTYVGGAIQCWCPAEFKSWQIDYTKSYCWIKNTYFIPMHESIPTKVDSRNANEITYYQWVPLILLFMAFMFKVPNLIWTIMSPYSGINLNKIVGLTMETQLGDPAKHEETVSNIATFMSRWLETNRVYEWNMCARVRGTCAKMFLLCSRRHGTFLSGLYIIVKCLYVVNVISQFFLLNMFMGDMYSPWGIEAVRQLSRDYEIQETRRFPRATLCDFKIRQLQNIQPFTVQCVLPINIFNEKIFLFLWIWLAIVAACTCSSLVLWARRVLFRRNRDHYIRKQLQDANDLHYQQDGKQENRFSAIHLRDDGVFLLRIVRENSNDVLTKDIMTRMWNHYLQRNASSSGTLRRNGVPASMIKQDSSDKASAPPECECT